jgi:hypothetical protein
MPFDARVQRALAALAGRRAEFRAAVETAYAQTRGFLAAHGPRVDERSRETALELGQFAGGRVDAARFAALVTAARVLSPEEETAVRRCGEVMDEVLAQGDGLFVCDVPPDADLHAAVDAALAEAGRAFGAAAAFQAVKTGEYRAEKRAPALRAFPFRRWSRGERLLAPPLVVAVDGADLQAGVLAEYLDGRQAFVVVVRGAATPAPLARLIAPRSYVAQLSDGDEGAEAALARAAAYGGPSIAALVPPGAARFVHDPAAGGTLARRLGAVVLPAEPPRAAVGGHSVAQQREELSQLAELADLAKLSEAENARHAEANATTAARASASGEGGAHLPPPTSDPSLKVEVLTRWLLAQAGLPASNGVAAGGTPR